MYDDLLKYLKDRYPESDKPKDVEFEPLVRLLSEYTERINYWHKFQDENKMIGNDYYWWLSRWCEDHPIKDNFENYKKQKLFKKIWKEYQQKFTRLNWTIEAA